MAKLIYTTLMSIDGYIEDPDGKFDWAAPDEEVHRFINDLQRSASTYLYGRRMYETMAVWETDPALVGATTYTRDFAGIWQSADKIVYSRTLPSVYTTRTTLERDFDPESIRKLKATAGSDLGIGGPGLAAHAFRAGLVDECHLFLSPVVTGGGKPALPTGTRLDLVLLAERRFENGIVYARYQVR